MTGIELKRQQAPIWVPLYNGAELLCLPASTPLVYAARATASSLLVDLLAGGIAVTKFGAQIEGLPDLSDPDALEAARQALFLISLAETAVSDWKNVKEGTSNIPFDTALLAELFTNPQVADAFSKNYLAERSAVVAEGNA